MILAGTSAWAQFGRAAGSPAGARLTGLIAGDGLAAVTEPVIMGVLAGARDDIREAQLRRLLRFRLCAFDPAAGFDGAVRLYRRCRKAGVTPRSLTGCMIAAVAWRYQASALTCDADLRPIADISLDQPPAR